MLNSENIEEYEEGIKNDIKIQYKNNHQNILNCNNIYYEEIKKTKDKRNIKIFLFITCENKNIDINIKIDNCISLLKEKINKQNEQNINFDIKKNITIYKNFNILLDDPNKNHNFEQDNLYYIIFPLAVKTNNYFNFLKKFNKEYKEKFKDELFNDEKDYMIFFNKKIQTCGLRLPYFIYPNIEEKENYYDIYLPSSNVGNQTQSELIKNLRCKLDILIESEKKKCIIKQDSEVKKIYGVYENIFKDILKYKKGKCSKRGIKHEDIKIVIDDYENEEIEEEIQESENDELNEESEEETEEDNNKESEKIKEENNEETVEMKEETKNNEDDEDDEIEKEEEDNINLPIQKNIDKTEKKDKGEKEILKIEIDKKLYDLDKEIQELKNIYVAIGNRIENLESIKNSLLIKHKKIFQS